MVGSIVFRSVLMATIGLSVFTLSACRSTNGASALREDAAATPVDTALVANAAKAALDKNCASCHNASNVQGTIGYITDLQKLVDKKKVKRGTPDDQKKSRVLVRLKDTENPMPPVADDNNAPLPRVSDEDAKAIEAWIMADSPVQAAPTPAPGG